MYVCMCVCVYACMYIYILSLAHRLSGFLPSNCGGPCNCLVLFKHASSAILIKQVERAERETTDPRSGKTTVNLSARRFH